MKAFDCLLRGVLKGLPGSPHGDDLLLPVYASPEVGYREIENRFEARAGTDCSLGAQFNKVLWCGK